MLLCQGDLYIADADDPPGCAYDGKSKARVTFHACRCAYTNWTATAKDCNDFYTDVNAIKLYKRHVKTVLKRVNTVSGISYANDPTILGKPLAPSS